MGFGDVMRDIGDTVGKVFPGARDQERMERERLGRQAADAEAEALRREAERKRRALSEARTKKMEELEAAENELRGELVRSTKEVGSAIDTELEGLVEKVGYQAGRAKAITGEQAAQRGLLRSSFATEELGEVSRRELEQKSLARASTEGTRREVAVQTQKVLDSISDRRAKIAEQIGAANDAASVKALNLFDMNRIQDSFQQTLSQLQISSANKRQLIGSLGSLIGDVTEIAFRESK